jgi:hypothetical protein
MAVAVAFGEKLRQGQIHGPGNLGERIERWDGVAVLHPRQVSAQKASAFLDVALGHAALEPEITDGLADIHRHATNSALKRNSKKRCCA